MKEQLLRQLHSVKTMSIVGMCKNAGKTTMLNWLLEQGKLQGVLGLTSIGRDGESTDIVTGTENFRPGGPPDRHGQGYAAAGGYHQGNTDDHRHPRAFGRGGDRPGTQRRTRSAGRDVHHHAAENRVQGVF